MSVTSALGNVAFQIPVLLILLLGIAVAIIHWQRQPRVALLALAGLGILLLMRLVGGAAGVWLPVTLSQQAIPLSNMARILTAWGLISSVINAVGYLLVIAAIFADRRE